MLLSHPMVVILATRQMRMRAMAQTIPPAAMEVPLVNLDIAHYTLHSTCLKIESHELRTL